jgi:hypothetical protein
MTRPFPHAKPAIPAFRSSRPDCSTGRRHTAAPARHEQRNEALMAEANRHASIRRAAGPVYDRYADCERAPFLWENRRG